MAKKVQPYISQVQKIQSWKVLAVQGYALPMTFLNINEKNAENKQALIFSKFSTKLNFRQDLKITFCLCNLIIERHYLSPLRWQANDINRMNVISQVIFFIIIII